MLYENTVGYRSVEMPADATHLGSISTHFMSGTRTCRYYADTPVSDEDRARFEQLKKSASKENARDIPIWM